MKSTSSNKKNGYESIENAIFKGLEQSCRDILTFNSDFNFEVKPEYLLTINIAKSINEISLQTYPPSFNIKLEENTRNAATLSVPQMSTEKTGSFLDIFTMAYRKPHNTSRKGKIDIVVYETMKDEPITAVEVKLIDPQRNKILQDLIRLEELIHLQDPKTGASKVRYTYFTCLSIDNKAKDKADREKHHIRCRKKYNDILKTSLKKNTKFKIILKVLAEDLLLENQAFSKNDSDYNHELYTKCRSVAGIVIKLWKE